MLDNLSAWLQRVAKPSGPLWNQSRRVFDWHLHMTHKRAMVKCKPNGLRHSFVSYRVAVVLDPQKVALEAGNSPEMIFSNYREVVTPDEAKAFWAIAPRPIEPSLEMNVRKRPISYHYSRAYGDLMGVIKWDGVHHSVSSKEGRVAFRRHRNRSAITLDLPELFSIIMRKPTLRRGPHGMKVKTLRKSLRPRVPGPCCHAGSHRTMRPFGVRPVTAFTRWWPKTGV